METDLYINDTLTIPGRELWAVASLSGGPGGQHVNKVSSRITLYWQVVASTVLTDEKRALILNRLASRISADGVLQVSADTFRSQHRNREEVRQKLATLVASSLKTQRKRIPTRVGLAARRRRLDNKKRRGALKKLRHCPQGNTD